MSADLLGGIYEGVYLFALCHILARVEIHIEGAHGWAVNLPTWRWGPSWWLNMTNGKELTGYHLWLTLFLIGMFHLPLIFNGWSAQLWAKCVSSYMMITAAWDLQWFVWNPHWGFNALRTREVPWFRKKIGGLPVDYFMGYLVAGVLTALIYRPGLEMFAGRALAVATLSILSVPAAKLATR